MSDPNHKSPANLEAAQMHQNNYKEYVRRVKILVEKSQEDMSDEDDDEDEQSQSVEKQESNNEEV